MGEERARPDKPALEIALYVVQYVMEGAQYLRERGL
jgi:hypothetical protein